MSDFREQEREQGLVSVVVPTYNRAERLQVTIRSVFEQDYRPLEIIIVDDGSTDHTASVIQKLDEEAKDHGCRLRYRYQPNRGAPAARNTGVDMSSGEFVQYLDSDDLLLPGKLSSQVDQLSETGHDLVYGVTLYTGPSGRVRRILDCPPNGETRCGWITELSWDTSSPLFRHSLVNKIGPWRTDLMACQEYEYGARAKIECSGIDFHRKPVSVAVLHQDDRISSQDKVTHATSAARAAEYILTAIAGTRWDRMCERNHLAMNVATHAAALSRRGEDRAARQCRRVALRAADGETIPFVWLSLLAGRILRRYPGLRQGAWWLRKRIT